MANIGYARVSTADQNLESQITALQRAGCEIIFTEKRSGAKRDRAELGKALASLQPGDTFIVFKLSRAARSLRHLLAIVDDLGRRRIGFVSLTENVNTTTMTGRLLLNIIGAIDEFLRELIVEHTNAGLEAARARGHISGPPPYGIGPDHTTVVESEAALLREAAERIIGGEPMSRVVSEWNARGERTRKGGLWRTTPLREQLRNPRTTAILGADVHAKIAALLNSPGRQALGPPAQHLLSGILRCGVCDERMYWRRIGHRAGKPRQVYRCEPAASSGGRFHGCGAVSVSAPPTDLIARDMFVGAMAGPGSKLGAHLATQLAALHQGGPTPDQLAAEAQELDELETIMRTRFATPEHRARAATLEGRAGAAAARMRQQPDLEALASLPRTEAALLAKWERWSVPERRAWLRRVLHGIGVRPAAPAVRHRGSNIAARLDPAWKL